MERHRKIIFTAGVLAAVIGGAVFLARQGLGKANLWAGVLGLPVGIIGAAAAVWTVFFPDRRPWRSRRALERQRRAELSDLLRTGLGPDGKPPTVAAADLYEIGISRAKPVAEGKPDRYIERAEDNEICEKLRTDHFVIVKGEAKAGKSRSAFEAVRALYPDAPLIAPDRGKSALAQIVQKDLLQKYPARLVFWLDGLDSFLTPTEGLNRALVAQLRRLYPQALLVATIQGPDLSRLRSRSADPTGTVSDVLEGVTEVFLDNVPTEAELARARELYPGEDFGAQTGIAEQLIAADLLRKRFQDREDKTGWCLVMAAVDWSRMGATNPVPERLLRALALDYRDARFPNMEIGDAELQKGFGWAEQTVGSAEALLNVAGRHPERTYRPFDPLRAYVRTLPRAEAVLSACWETAVAMAAPIDLIAIAMGALVKGPELRQTAKRALSRVLDSDEKHPADWAALLLAELQVDDGNTEVARQLLTRAAKADDATVAGLATVDMGVLLINTGELEQAKGLLEAAVNSGNPVVVPLTQAVLGSLLITTGDLAQGRQLLEVAADSGNPVAAAFAQAILGGLLMNAGDLARGLQLLDAAISSRNPQAVALAQATLGGWLVDTGDLAQGRQLLDAAISSRNPQAVALAQAALGGLLMTTGQPEQARELLEAALKSKNPLVVPVAQTNLGNLLALMGQLKEARELLEAAVRTRNPLVLPLAQANLGNLLARTGEPERARELLEAAVKSGNPVVIPLARITLALLLQDSGEPEQAREMVEAAVKSRNPRVVPLAQAVLGGLLMDTEDLDRARKMLEAAVKSGIPPAVALARTNLAGLLIRSGELDRAQKLLEATPSLANQAADPRAQYLLGTLSRAQYMLGTLRKLQHDWAGAEAAYQAAIDADDEPWKSHAQIELVFLRQERREAQELFEPAGSAPLVIPRSPDLATDQDGEAAGLADWIEEWCKAAAGARADFPERPVPLPRGSLLLIDRLTITQRALAQRNWNLARPVLRAAAARLRIWDREVPAPGTRAGLFLLLARIDVFLGEDPAADLSAARAQGAGLADMAVVQAWHARQGGRLAEAAARLAEAREGAVSPAVLAEIVIQARESSAENALSAARDGLAGLASISGISSQLVRLVEPAPPELWLAVADRAAAEHGVQLGTTALDHAERGAGNDYVLAAMIRERRADRLAGSSTDVSARADALAAAGDFRMSAGQPDVAERHYQAALDLRPEDARTAMSLANARAVTVLANPGSDPVTDMADVAARLESLHSGHSADCGSLWSLITLADLRMRLAAEKDSGTDNSWRAVLAIGQALVLAPDSADWWVRLASALESLSLYRCAAFAAKRAQALDPGPQLRDSVVDVLISSAANLGDIQAAQALLPDDAGNSPAWTKAAAGFILWRLGSRPDAIRLLRRAAMEEPRLLWARSGLMQAYLLTGEAELARREARELTTDIGEQRDRDALSALAWGALISGDVTGAERLGSELSRRENDTTGEGEGLAVVGMAKLLTGRDGLDDLAVSIERARTPRAIDDWQRIGRPVLEALALEHGVTLPELKRLDDVITSRRATLAAWADPLTELAEAPPGAADAVIVSQARAMLHVLICEAKPDPAGARAAPDVSIFAAHPLPEWPKLAERVLKAYVSDCLTRGDLDGAAAAECERLIAASLTGSADRIPEIALRIDAAGRHDDAERVIDEARQRIGNLPELSRTEGDIQWRRGRSAEAAVTWEAARAAGAGRIEARLAASAAASDRSTAADLLHTAIARSYAETATDLCSLRMGIADKAAVIAALEEAAADSESAPGAWVAIRALIASAEQPELPDHSLQVLLPSSWFTGMDDPVAEDPLMVRYLPEARLRLPWSLPGVSVGDDASLEPDGYKILVLGTTFERGKVAVNACYVPTNAVPLLSPATQARLTDTRLMDLLLLSKGGEPTTGLDSLLLMSAAEVVARRTEAVATVFRSALQQFQNHVSTS